MIRYDETYERIRTDEKNALSIVVRDMDSYSVDVKAITSDDLMSTPEITWNGTISVPYMFLGEYRYYYPAHSNVDGTFDYEYFDGEWIPLPEMPSISNFPQVGTYPFRVVFSPTDAGTYRSVTIESTLTIRKAQVLMTIADVPSSLVYGTPLPGDAYEGVTVKISSAGSYSPGNVVGTVTGDPMPGSIMDVGSHVLRITFTPDDLRNFPICTGTANLTVSKRTPIVTWRVLSNYSSTDTYSSVMTATSSVDGTYVYKENGVTLSSSTTMSSGSHTVSMTFTPTDTTNNNEITLTRSFDVASAGLVVPTIVWNPSVNYVDNNATWTSSLLNASAVDGNNNFVAGTMSYYIGGQQIEVGDTIVFSAYEDTVDVEASFVPTDQTTYDIVTLTYSFVARQAYLNVSPSTLFFSGTQAKTANVSVYSNSSWTLTDQGGDNAFTVTIGNNTPTFPYSGSGDVLIRFRSRNSGTTEKVHYYRVTSGSIVRNFTVKWTLQPVPDRDA